MTVSSENESGPTLRPETLTITSGRSADGTALAPVLCDATTFVTDSVDEGHRLATSTTSSKFYGRYGNPTVRAFEEAIANLEGAERARAYGSGMGAVTGTILALCSKGDHVVAQRQIYSGTQAVLQNMCPRFGIDVTFVDGTDPAAWEAAVRPGKTVLLVGETPANPRLDIVDLEALGAIKGPLKVVDSTFATPLGQQPLAFGIDLVLHSATKAIAGHNDATLGVVAGSAELIEWLWGFAVLQGANASPHDAHAGTRGLRTLGPRLRTQQENAERLAEALSGHDAVAEVLCVASAKHPQAELIDRQMAFRSGLLTIELAGGLAAGRRFVEATRLCRFATSLGGPETLVTHPASTTHVNLLPEEKAAAGITDGTIRISVGLEHPDDILEDMLQALS